MGRTQTRRSDSSNSCHWTTADLATTDSHSRAGLKTSTLLVCVWLSQQQQQSVPCGRTTLCVCSKNIRLLSPHWQFFFLHSRKCLCGAIAKMLKCIKSEKEEKKNQICPQAGYIDWQQQGRVEGLRLRGENCQKRSFLNVLCDAQSSQWYCGEEERGAYFLDCILKDKKEYINSYGLLHWAMGGDRDIYYIRFLILIDTFFCKKTWHMH